MSTEHCILELLRRHMAHGAVDETTLQRIASGLTGRLNDLGDAARRKEGDPTVKTYERELHKNNLKKVDDAFKHAHALRESCYSNEGMRAELNKFLWEMDALKKCMQATRSTSQGKLPKVARLYLCVEIIVAWKLIKKTKEIPRRQKNKEQDPVGEFHYFIKALLTAAGGHVANASVDELHKGILETAKELGRLKEKADNPKITFLD